MAGAAKRPVKKSVKVGDNFYSPRKLTLPRNSTVVWKWLPGNGETHDVRLTRRPKRAKRFVSAPAATDYSYEKKLTRTGRYTIICTYHEDMAQSIKVVR